MKRFLSLILCLLAFTGVGATIQWYSQQPLTTTPRDSDVMVLETTGPQGYKSFTLLTLKDWIGTNGPSTFYITNLVTQNLYSSNAYFTNLTVLNEFHGKTSFFSNSYITNLYLTQIVTNYYLFSTNLFITNNVNNAYVSNYFVTNIFNNDAYVSNYFTTNTYNYATNIYNYSTNLTVTNFYLNNTYVSNYFNTNIFTTNNAYISNFFTTNIYNTINISSNYTYQYSINPTNLTMYGHTFMLGYQGDPAPTLIMLSETNEVFIDAGLGMIMIPGPYYGASYQTKEIDWEGPTNSIDPHASDYFYTAFTPCRITGFDGPLPDPRHSWSGLLTITNASASNILLTLPSGMTIPERTNQVAISNASRGMISMKWSHRSGTNGVYRQF